METYYLYQPTTEITTGPHTISQIQSMWTNGAITTETLIASATAPDEWSPAHYLIEARPEPSPMDTLKPTPTDADPWLPWQSASLSLVD